MPLPTCELLEFFECRSLSADEQGIGLCCLRAVAKRVEDVSGVAADLRQGGSASEITRQIRSSAIRRFVNFWTGLTPGKQIPDGNQLFQGPRARDGFPFPSARNGAISDLALRSLVSRHGRERTFAREINGHRFEIPATSGYPMGIPSIARHGPECKPMRAISIAKMTGLPRVNEPGM